MVPPVVGSSPCIDDAAVARLLADEVSASERGVMLAHADGCGDCRRLLAAVAQPLGNKTSAGDAEDTLPSNAAMTRGLRPQPGDVIEHYTVVEVLGQGAMGVVVQARDSVLGRDVALKLLVHTRSEDAERRLVREAQAMAQLSHPNVVTVHAVGRYDRGLYIAMELVRGQTLQRWCDAEPRPWAQVLRRFVEAGKGLAAAHGQGLVHRDFKPDNVLVRSDGQVLVTDFGLAGAGEAWIASADDGSLELGTSLTRTGVVMGTPRFMAPEQYRDSREVGPQADQFSFAVSLYAALYGRYPFVGNDLTSLRTSVSEGVPATPSVRVSVPRGVWAVLRRALQRDPDDRYPSMYALLLRLEQIVDRPARRRRNMMLAGAAVAVLAGGVAVGAGIDEEPEILPCANVEARLDGVWDAASADAVRQALAVAPDTEIATETSRRLQNGMDAYARAWTITARNTCEATHVHGVQTDALLDVRMACLEESRTALAALGEGLVTRPVDEVLEHAVTAVVALPDATDCAHREAGLAEVPARDASAVAQVSALILLGAYEEVEPLAAELAPTLSSSRATAQLWFARGRAHRLMEQFAEAVAPLDAAALAAAEAGDDQLIARARLELLDVRMSAERYELADTLLESARMAVRRVGDPARLKTRLDAQHGRLAMAREDHATALVQFDAALELAERSGADALTQAGVLQHRAIALAAAGRGEEAGSDALALLELRREQLGEHHPLVADARFQVARAVLVAGRPQDAEEQLAQALTTIERIGGPLDLRAAEILLAQATVELQRGQVQRGTELAERSMAILEHHGKQDDQRAFTVRTVLGAGYSMQGRHDDAVREVGKTIAARERIGGTDDPAYAFDLSVYAEALHRAGRPEQALAVFEKLSRVASDQSPLYAAAWAGIGVTTMELGRPGAKEALDKALAQHQKVPLSDFDRGSISMAMAHLTFEEHPAKAVALAESALALVHGPDSEPLRADIELWLATHRDGR